VFLYFAGFTPPPPPPPKKKRLEKALKAIHTLKKRGKVQTEKAGRYRKDFRKLRANGRYRDERRLLLKHLRGR
jgi:hypothetical protein